MTTSLPEALGTLLPCRPWRALLIGNPPPHTPAEEDIQTHHHTGSNAERGRRQSGSLWPWGHLLADPGPAPFWTLSPVFQRMIQKPSLVHLPATIPTPSQPVHPSPCCQHSTAPSQAPPACLSAPLPHPDSKETGSPPKKKGGGFLNPAPQQWSSLPSLKSPEAVLYLPVAPPLPSDQVSSIFHLHTRLQASPLILPGLHSLLRPASPAKSPRNHLHLSHPDNHGTWPHPPCPPTAQAPCSSLRHFPALHVRSPAPKFCHGGPPPSSGKVLSPPSQQLAVRCSVILRLCSQVALTGVTTLSQPWFLCL